MKNFENVLSSIAEKEGISKQEVYSEMQKAINAGFFNMDPTVQAAWKKLRLKNPKPEDIISRCVNQILHTKSKHFG